MQTKKTALEAAISEAIIKFQRNIVGRGPVEAKAYILEDMVFIRMRGVLTVEEANLATTERGRQVVKELRMVLRETYSAEAEKIISELVGCRVISSHSDISTKTGEQVVIHVLEENLEKRLKSCEKSCF